MEIEDFFPEDPSEPTIKYIGKNQMPFAVPWGNGRVQICAGLNTQRTQDADLFMLHTAFQDISNTHLEYRECHTISIKDESGSNMANSAEDTSFAISASVGGSFLGASGRGNYEKNVRSSRTTSNLNVRADLVCAQIDIIHAPRLGKDAVRLLSSSLDPVNDFIRDYGDYFVAGCRVGAVTNTTISGDLVNKTFFGAKRAELEVKALFVKIKKSINEVSQSASNAGGLKVTAFDSLSAYYSSFIAVTQDDAVQAAKIASENKQRAMTIAARAAEVLWREFSLGHEKIVCQETVDKLCDRGLVTELLLVPFASLREYQSFLSCRSVRY